MGWSFCNRRLGMRFRRRNFNCGFGSICDNSGAVSHFDQQVWESISNGVAQRRANLVIGDSTMC
jgi:hypothetical protein